MQTLFFDLGDRAYPIHIGPGLLDRADLVLPHLKQKRAVIVTNATVGPLYLERLSRTLASADERESGRVPCSTWATPSARPSRQAWATASGCTARAFPLAPSWRPNCRGAWA